MTTRFETDRLLTLRAMARRLGVTQQWLRQEAAAQRVPALRAGTKYLFDAAAVEAVILDRAARGDGDE